LEIRQNLRSVPSRPVVLVIAILAVLALALTAWSVLATGAGSHNGTGTGQSVTSNLGPDTRSLKFETHVERGGPVDHPSLDSPHAYAAVRAQAFDTMR